MTVVRDVCTIVPVVVMTATLVLGIGLAISLSSWSLL